MPFPLHDWQFWVASAVAAAALAWLVFKLAPIRRRRRGTRRATLTVEGKPVDR